MKRLTILAAIIGLGIAGALVAAAGAREVGAAVASLGWALLLIVALRSFAIAADGVAWLFLFPPGSRPSLWLCAAVRFIREGTNQLLPVAQVGGEVIGARVMTFFGVEGALAGATVIVDVLIQAGTQFVFALIGLLILLALGGDETVIRFVLIGLVLAALGLIGFFLVQRRMTFGSLERIIQKLAGDRTWLSLGALDRLYSRLADVHGNRGGVFAAVCLHMVLWFIGAFEVWVALRFMGFPVTYAESLVIESLGQAVRGAAFAVPGGLGVQEGGYIALCAMFGVPVQEALALSLAKRVADVAVGLPGLIAWQVVEGRRLYRRPEPGAPPVDP